MRVVTLCQKSDGDNKRGQWEAHRVQNTRMAAVIERDKVRETCTLRSNGERGRERLRQGEKGKNKGKLDRWRETVQGTQT